MSETIDCKECGGSGKIFSGYVAERNGVTPGEQYACTRCGGSGRVPLPLNPWTPISDATDLKHLGKLSEECGELSSAIARCIIQGVDGREPVTGKLNRDWLRDEIADVMANIALVRKRFGLDSADDSEKIMDRIERKMKHLAHWHSLGEP